MRINNFLDLVNSLKDLDEYILLIDGMCGSGKTSLAKYLKDNLDLNVVSIDNYYLPFEKRKDDWFELSGGNIDYERLINEVINPYLNKEDINLKRYNPHKEIFEDLGNLKYKPRLIIEGSYSFMDILSKYSTYRVFLKCSNERQKERLILREKDNYINFENKWIKKENLYFKDKDPEGMADYIIDTSDLF